LNLWFKKRDALIPKDAKVLEGCGGSRSGRPDRVVEVQRASGDEAAATGAIRVCGSGAKGRTGHGNYLEGSEVAG
jgi:hypothetical protein